MEPIPRLTHICSIGILLKSLASASSPVFDPHCWQFVWGQARPPYPRPLCMARPPIINHLLVFPISSFVGLPLLLIFASADVFSESQF